MHTDYSDTISRHEKTINVHELYKEYDQYKKYLPENTKSQILEIGCGEGYYLRYLINFNYANVVGIDNDPGAVKRCAEKEINNVFCEDACEYLIKITDNYFDAIIMNNVIEHFNKAELVMMLNLIHTKLKSGGVLIAKTGNIENPFNLGLFLRDFTHQIGFTKNSLRQVMLQCGFIKKNVLVLDIKYCSQSKIKTVVKQCTFLLATTAIKIFAKCMSMRIDSLSKLIVCIAIKEK